MQVGKLLTSLANDIATGSKTTAAAMSEYAPGLAQAMEAMNVDKKVRHGVMWVLRPSAVGAQRQGFPAMHPAGGAGLPSKEVWYATVHHAGATSCPQCCQHLHCCPA